MQIYTIYRYSETNHLRGEHTSSRYTAQPEAPESAMGHSATTGEPIGITISRSDAEPAFKMSGHIEIGRTDGGDECVWPSDSDIGEPIDKVMSDPRLRGELGINLERI